MAGIINDQLIFPILDLIQREINKSMAGIEVTSGQGGGPLSGIPSVVLERKHPADTSNTILTRAVAYYPNGFTMDVGLIYDDSWVLQMVTVAVLNPGKKPVEVYDIILRRDDRGILVAADVEQKQGNNDIIF